jgi:hypothetical protein
VEQVEVAQDQQGLVEMQVAQLAEQVDQVEEVQVLLE